MGQLNLTPGQQAKARLKYPDAKVLVVAMRAEVETRRLAAMGGQGKEGGQGGQERLV